MRRVVTWMVGGVLIVTLACWAAWAALNTGRAVEHPITVDGLSRKFLVFAPPKIAEPSPVVLAFHGGGGNARQMERYSRFDDVAEKEGFVVVYPEAVDGNWNDGRGMDFVRAQKENIDDVKFIRAVIDAVAGQQKIDRGRVFATGISNGAFISHRLAAEASDAIAAIAPVVGGMAPAIAENFAPKYPVSILIIQGDSDPLVPIGGGDVGFANSRKRGKVVDTQETLARYAKRNGNRDEPAIATLDADPNDGTTVEVTKYPDGPGGIETQYYLVKHGGHTWPGRPLYLPEAMIGKASQDFSASQTIWDFFESCPPRVLE